MGQTATSNTVIVTALVLDWDISDKITKDQISCHIPPFYLHYF